MRRLFCNFVIDADGDGDDEEEADEDDEDDDDDIEPRQRFHVVLRASKPPNLKASRPQSP